MNFSGKSPRLTGNAERAIPKILLHEGGFVDHPNDPGGATNKGITIATFRRYIKPSGTVADLKSLTTAQAVIVYKRQYWDAVCADMLPAGVDYAVADFAVNSGPSRAAKYLQRIVGAVEDGVIGPATLTAVKSKDAGKVINELCDDRLAFMKRIRGGSLWKTFGKGWARRVSEVRSVSLGWAEAPVAPIPDHVPVVAAKPAGGFFAALMAIFGGRT